MSYSKYYLYKKQVSYNNGVSWEDVTPLETAPSGDPIATYATLEECEGIVPQRLKFYATYYDGTTYSAACDSDTTLTTATTRAHTSAYSAMTNADIGDCVTSIGGSAFYDCTSLTSISIPSGVTSIGSWALANCVGLTNINLPNSLTSIGNNAIYGCSGLTSVNIPSGVTSIGQGAFWNCYNLTSVNIPNGVTSIANTVFANCYNLTNVSIPSGVTSIGQHAFQNCSGLTNINIPSGVTSIGYGAFWNCESLTSVVIPNSVTSIGNYTFYGCSSLTSVVIPNSVTSIGYGAFWICSDLISITVDATTPPELEAKAFDDTNECPIYVPCQSIDAYKSAWSSYASRIQCSEPKWFATYSDSHTDSAVCNSASSISVNEIPLTNLLSIEMSDCVTSIEAQAFRNCSTLTSATIGSGVTSIGVRAFEGCTNLQSIICLAPTPPNAGVYAFSSTNNCPIYVPCGKVDAYRSAWGGYKSQIQGMPPCGFKARIYRQGRTTKIECNDNPILTSGETISGISGWTIESVEIGDCVSVIGDSAFQGCSALTKVNSDTSGVFNIPSGITSLGNKAFSGCSGVTLISIPDTVTSIGNQALSECTTLGSVVLPDSVTTIGSGAFAHSWRISSIYIPSGLTGTLESSMFWYCLGLSRLNSDTDGVFNIPSGITSLGRSVFGYCSYLTNITIPSGITNISEQAFMDCHRLASIGSVGSGASVEIPDSVTTIDIRAFAYCTGLRSITIPDSVTTINTEAFSCCSGMINCTIGSGVTYIGYTAFYRCTSLTSVTCNAIIPPALGGAIFMYASDCPIYVPSESLEAYKTAWEYYASRIYPIQ